MTCIFSTATLILADKYGLFDSLVSVAGTIVAMGAAITAIWVGKADWQPVEEDFSQGSKQAASLLTAVAIALAWVYRSALRHGDKLATVVAAFAILLVLSLVGYGLLQGLVYSAPDSGRSSSKSKRSRRVIGGLWLRRPIRERKHKAELSVYNDQQLTQTLTVQKMFEDANYDKDAIWSKLSLQLSKQLFMIMYIVIIVSGTLTLASAAMLVGDRIEEAAGPQPIVLMGSSNVRSYLWDRLPGIVPPMKPLWLDLGSGVAEEDIFHAFDFGSHTSPGSRRTGLIALSSEADLPKLRDAFRDVGGNNSSSNDRIRNNYWLNIRIARQPLAMLYRGASGIPKVKNKLFCPGQAPPGVNDEFMFVSLNELKLFIEAPRLNDTVQRPIGYLPEEKTGTRLALENAAAADGTTISWPKSGFSPPGVSVEKLAPNISPSFVWIGSALPWSDANERPARCEEIKDAGIRTAVITTNDGLCAKPVTADFAVVIKVLPQHDEAGTFLIQNAAECRIAEALSDRVKECKITGVVDSQHVVEVEASTNEVPKYFGCK